MPLSVIVLAAGQGKRMNSALPKVLQPLGGRPMLAHVIDRARSVNAAGIHIVYGHGGDEVQAAFPAPDLKWWHQAEQLGTGHAVAQAMPGVPEGHRVLVLCGDVPLIKLESLLRLLADTDADSLGLLTARLPDASGYGRIVRRDDGSVLGVVEHQDATDEQLQIEEINTGIIVAGSSALRRWLEQIDNDNAQGEYYLPDIIGLANAEQLRVSAVPVDEAMEAFGINDKIQLAAAERKLQQTTAEELMRAGATIVDPARVDVRGNLRIGQDVYIDVNAVFEGDVRLGDGCRIESNCVIRDSVLGPGTIVHPNSVIDASTTGADCEIGPFARVRPGVELADKVKIGNFVEVKKSKIGDGSKVNHLSYVGDATIGQDVNVGAGTITCNYDGANKHPTTIGDRAFIGSGVNLVAPVDVGADATVGAGTTLTKAAPEGELTLGRAKQTTVTGWKRPMKESD